LRNVATNYRSAPRNIPEMEKYLNDNFVPSGVIKGSDRVVLYP